MNFQSIREYFGVRYVDAYFMKSDSRSLCVEINHVDAFDQGADIVFLAQALNIKMSNVKSRGNPNTFNYHCEKVPRPPNDARVIAYARGKPNTDYDLDERPMSEIMELINALLTDGWDSAYLECSTGDSITFYAKSRQISYAHWIPRFKINV